MSKKLAIIGHSTRGEEVFELLEMLGGNINKKKLSSAIIGDILNPRVYFFDPDSSDNRIVWYYLLGLEADGRASEMKIFTLEEFLEKYPFKVGDKVVYTKFGDNCNDYPVTIESMEWTGTTIEYTFDGCVTCLAKDLKMWNEEPDAVISGINLNSCDYADEVELNLGDYEIEVRNGRTFAVKKKPKYPTTYEECWKVRFEVDGETTLKEFHHVSGYYSESLGALQKLLCCRDAYWKIAGEEMGLDKPRKPDWKNTKNVKYGITLYDDIITKMYLRNENVILAFPTEEMRDAFYENFKDLIEECKELL